MRLYSLAHRKDPETEGGDYEHVYILSEVGIGQIVNKLRRMDFTLLYQYVVFETEEQTGEILDKQNADEWLLDYLRWVKAKGMQLGDLVGSIYKSFPLYRIEKMHHSTVWLRPATKDGEVWGAIQKSVPYSTVELYRG